MTNDIAEKVAKKGTPTLIERSDHITDAITGAHGIYHLARWSDHDKFMELFDGSIFQSHEITYVEEYSRSLRG